MRKVGTLKVLGKIGTSICKIRLFSRLKKLGFNLSYQVEGMSKVSRVEHSNFRGNLRFEIT